MSKPIAVYGGQIMDIQGEISFESLDKILDMLDHYIELLELLEETENDSSCNNL